MRKMLALLLFLSVFMALFAADSAIGSFQISARKPTMSTETGTYTAVIYNTYGAAGLESEEGTHLSPGTQILVDLANMPAGGNSANHVPLFDVKVTGDYIPANMELTLYLRPFINIDDSSADLVPVHFLFDWKYTASGVTVTDNDREETDVDSAGVSSAVGDAKTISIPVGESPAAGQFDFTLSVQVNRLRSRPDPVSDQTYVMTLDAVLTIDGE